MIKQILIIKGELTDLNSYIKALNSHYHAGNKIKQLETARVAAEALNQKILKVTSYPVHITYTWYSKDQRMDTDNVAFAKKFINDGLVLAKVLENDSRKFIGGFSDLFLIDKEKPRVEVMINKL